MRTFKMMKTARGLRMALAACAMMGLVQAGAWGAATITTVGAGTGYDDTTPAYLSTNVAKPLDIDGDNVYGTSGLLMFGLNGGTDVSGQPFSAHIAQLPTWVTASAGADFNNVAYGFSNYTAIDQPEQTPGPDVVNWGSRSGIATATSGGAADAWRSIVDFTVDAGAPSQFRLGVMAGNEGNFDGRWDPTGIQVVGPDASIATVTGLANVDPGLGWVFFDIDTGGATGTFTIQEAQRNAAQGGSIAGFTFDAPVQLTGDQIVNFDFGAGLNGGVIQHPTYSSVDADANAAPDTWNNLGNVPGLLAGGTVGNDINSAGYIQDINGNQTDYTLSFSGILGQDTNNANLVSASEWDETVLDVPDEAVDGHYFGEVLTFTLDGLDPLSSGHSIEIFDVFDAAADTEFTVNGDGPVSHDRQAFFTGGNDELLARIVFTDITADALGRIVIVADRVGTGNAAVQAIRFTRGTASAIVPTPAALPAGLVMLGALVMRRRK